ncbi:unnamed protein product, partial [Prorocentrum cordatum]
PFWLKVTRCCSAPGRRSAHGAPPAHQRHSLCGAMPLRWSAPSAAQARGDLGVGSESADESRLVDGPVLNGDPRPAGAPRSLRRAWAAGALAGAVALALLAAGGPRRRGGAAAPPLPPAGTRRPLQLQEVVDLGDGNVVEVDLSDGDIGEDDVDVEVQAVRPTCPGGIDLPGEGYVNLVNAMVNTPGDAAQKVEVQDGAVVAWMSGRTYFAESCSEESYEAVQYKALSLLGRTIKWTVDLNGAGCGCNAAVYLTSLAQNTKKSECSDYYCDANRVCGVPCAEVDLQEANMHSWRSTLHTAEDGAGSAAGYGGTGPHKKSWGPADYGPDGNCVATTAPFDVEVGFPVDANGVLKAMQVILSQEGRPCKISATIDSYTFGGKNGMAEISEALAAGMTPIISYWSNEGLGWMDGSRSDPAGGIEGDCEMDTPRDCPEYVKIYGFSVFDGVSEPPPTTTPLPPSTTPCSTTIPGQGVAAGVGAGVFQPAAAQVPAPAPASSSPWLQVTQGGQTYFYNPQTGVTAWTIPGM